MNRKIKIDSNPLSLAEAIEFVEDKRSGGLNIFLGNVRNHTQKENVLKLEFEAYTPMAIKEMDKICDAAFQQWEINKIAFFHRVGTLVPSETAVLVVVGADHRDAAFKACRFCIDQLKEKVPIWKKEFFENGEVWVAAHP